jgi:hypothetical protein
MPATCTPRWQPRARRRWGCSRRWARTWSSSTPASKTRWKSPPGLWFAGSWTLWNTLSPAQQAVTDPDFAAQARLGERLSVLELQRLHPRRGALAAHMRQFMQRFDLLVTPSVAVPAFEARPAGQQAMTPESMLGWTPFSYPFNLTQQPAITVPCGLSRRGPAHRAAARGPDVRRRTRAARGTGLRIGLSGEAAEPRGPSGPRAWRPEAGGLQSA